MSPVSGLPALGALMLAFATGALLTRGGAVVAGGGRFTSIDGLRGYLALCVFFSHGCLWYFYLRSDAWVVPPSALYTHMGQSSVALFFMITGFLFFSKLIDARRRPMDWDRFFISRLLRLAPLYLLATGLVFLIVVCLSHGTLREPLPMLAKHVVEWLAFSIVGGPNINGVENSVEIVAGVTWSLQYEWLFYMSLPVVGRCLRLAVPIRYLFLGAGALLAGWALKLDVHHLLEFAGGMLAAIVVRSRRFCRVSSHPGMALVVVGAIGAAVLVYPNAHAAAPLLLLSAAFAVVAGGNDLCGFLLHPVSRLLGQMAYSIYLLHGILLFVTFRFAFGEGVARTLSPEIHWLIVIGLMPVLVVMCHVTYLRVELPAMQRVAAVTAWLRARLANRRRAFA